MCFFRVSVVEWKWKWSEKWVQPSQSNNTLQKHHPTLYYFNFNSFQMIVKIKLEWFHWRWSTIVAVNQLIKQANSFTQIQLSLRFNQFNFNFNLRFQIPMSHCDCGLELKTLSLILERANMTQLISWKKKQNSEQCCSFIKIIITNNKCFHCCYGNIFHCVVMIFSCYHVIIFD